MVHQLPEVRKSFAVGQDRRGDVRVILFVVLRGGRALDDGLRGRIRTRLRERTSPQHLPPKILQLRELPQPVSRKLVDLAVREVFHGRPVANFEALAQLQVFDQFPELAELGEPSARAA